MEELIAESVVNALIKRGWRISFAESCTGGLVSAALVDIPNASLVFDAGVVTYANEAKVRYLGVSEVTIAQYGVVSEQVAGEMAEGVAKRNHAQAGVGISGIAGPSGGTKEKPVGMVCFGFWINGELTTETMYFGEIGRNRVRHESVAYVYRTLKELLRA